MKVEKIEMTEQEVEEMKQQLSDEELDEVAGGFAYRDGGPFRQDRLMFSLEEAAILSEHLGVQLVHGIAYKTSELKDLGIPGKNGREIEKYLKEQLGFQSSKL